MNEHENFLCGIGIGLICGASNPQSYLPFIGVAFCLWGCIPCIIRDVRAASKGSA